MSGWPRQAFRLDKAIIDSVSKEEVKATIDTMKELKICHAPFDQMDIIVFERELFRLYSDNPRVNDAMLEESKAVLAASTREVIFRFDHKQLHPKVVTCLMNSGRNHWVDMVDFIMWAEVKNGKPPRDFGRTVYEIGLELLDILIVLLATKNIIKEVKEHKCVRLGIGGKNKHQYTTTLKIGQISERTDPGEHTGLPVRPHLRRGHIRNQAHGPNFQYRKSIWIEPIFVNADSSWIESRTAYNVSLASPVQTKQKEKVA